MASAIDITNQKFGKLLVLKRAGSVNNRATQECLCDCGNKIIVNGSDLRRGRKKDCGCTYLKKKMELQNQKFGKLLALYPTSKRDNEGCIIQHCKCECGNETDVSSTDLRTGHTKSCGCTRTEKLIKYNKENNIIDLTNQKFGILTALYPTEERSKQNNVIQYCKCDCGNYIKVKSNDLKSGNTKSCGCMRNKSYGEKKIGTILKNNNINFIKEYVIKELNNFRFDFYLPELNCAIEYDGIQHFKQGHGNYDNEEKFNKTIQHDQIKNQYCKEKNIILIRIPYTHYEDLDIKDLLPKSSNFIYK